MDATRIHDVPALDTFLVERYWPGVTEAAFTDAARRVQACVDALHREGALIRTLSSTLVPADEAAYWVVEAPSMDIVELAYERAGVPFERIVMAVEAPVLEGVPAERVGLSGRDGRSATGRTAGRE